jgi:hypothetical protein
LGSPGPIIQREKEKPQEKEKEKEKGHILLSVRKIGGSRKIGHHRFRRFLQNLKKMVKFG